MGEVYRARDARLTRDVAIKVLPLDAGAHPDRQARFEQEARAAAALNHPNILAVYDIGVDDGTPYVVSELLEGKTLAARLREGPLPIGKAIDYGAQIARGLAAAHARDIVHRDLKPANIFITVDGRAKILDFGIAKLLPAPVRISDALDTLPSSRAPELDLTRPADTTPGLVFGTAGYMAPEQVRGQPVDHRADLFSFGVVLYEMVTGTRAFERETPPETMTATLRDDVLEQPLTLRHTPPALTRIIRRCVEKDTAGRFQSALDLAFALEALDTTPSGAAAASGGRRVTRELVAWTTAGAVLIAAIAFAVATRQPREEAGPPPPVRFALQAAPGVGPGPAAAAVPAISPDGRRVAFVGGGRLWIHALEELAPRPVGRGGAGQAIFWSPDGRTLAYNAGTSIRLIGADGGAERTACELPTAFMRGGTMNVDGVIVVGSAGGGLMRCPAGGGPVERLTQLNAARQDSGHYGPTFLPDGKQLLYWAQPSGTVWLTSLDGAAPREVLTSDSVARYVDPGYLLFVRKGTLFAQRFDAATGTLGGDAAPVVDQVLSDASVAFGASFDSSRNGVLVYRAGFLREASQLTWVDRAGKALATVGQPGMIANPNLSVDGTRLAVERIDIQTRSSDIWLMDLARSNVFSRFTSDPGNEIRPVWSPDGNWIAFASDRTGIENIYRKRANGSGAEELLLKTEAIVPAAWLPDGSGLLYQRLAPISLGILSLGAAPAARLLDASRDQVLDRWAEVSPDGKWIAFSSQESGPYQIYVQAFPDATQGKWLVSGDTFGVYPRWSADGRELFFIGPDGWLMAVPVSAGTMPSFGAPRRLFEPKAVYGGSFGPGREQQYAVSADGQRFLVNASVGEAAVPPLLVVLNWPALLRR
jgi:Tol biopolymer transport system component